MTTQQLKETKWKDAGVYGLILGTALTLVMLISALVELDIPYTYASSGVQYMIMIVALSLFCKIRGAKYGDAGFTYGQCINFIIAVMLFAGIIVGVAGFILQQYVAPEYYRALLDQSLEQLPQQQQAQVDQQAIKESLQLMKSPIFMVSASIFNMIINGVFIGIFTSLFTRRQPQYTPKDTETTTNQE